MSTTVGLVSGVVWCAKVVCTWMLGSRFGGFGPYPITNPAVPPTPAPVAKSAAIARNAGGADALRSRDDVRVDIASQQSSAIGAPQNFASHKRTEPLDRDVEIIFKRQRDHVAHR